MKRGMIVSLIVLSLVVSPGIVWASEIKVDQWEIPFLNAWTGSAAGYGKLCDFFQKAAVGEINASGGIAGKPLVIQDCDTAMDPTRAASCMKKAAEKSLVIIGPMTSLATQVCAPIAAQQKVMAIPAAGGAETIQESRPWAVVLMMPNIKRAEFMMNTWVDRNPGIKSVVMLNFPKVGQWVKLVELRKAALAKRGVKTIEVIDVQAGAVDVSSVVVRALKSKPDGIVTSLMGADTVRIVQELLNRGFEKRGAIFSHSTVDSPETFSLSAEAGGVMEGTYMGAFGIKSDAAEFQKLLSDFRKVKGQENADKLMWGDLFYISTYMVKDAIEKTGVTGDPAKREEERAKIRDYINTMKNFNTRIRGPISAMPDGSFTVPNYLGIVKNNKLEIVTSTNEYYKE